MDPLDLATIISYETGGTFDPLQPGPTTQHGQHRGLIQFGEPQAAQHGANFSDPRTAIISQLGPGGAVESYFKGSGWQPGMNFLDAYSTVNAGAPGRYNASDANNGGAPGTVRDKVMNQMGPHRQKAMALMGMSSQGGGFAPPVPEGPGVVEALMNRDWRGAATAAGRELFRPGDASPGIAANRNAQLADALGAGADAMVNQIGQQQGPASWMQVLAAVGNKAGSARKAAQANEQMTQGNAELAQLMSTGSRDPATMARIMELNPELGQQIMIQRDALDAQIAAEQREFGYDMAKIQARAANAPPEPTLDVTIDPFTGEASFSYGPKTGQQGQGGGTIGSPKNAPTQANNTTGSTPTPGHANYGDTPNNTGSTNAPQYNAGGNVNPEPQQGQVLGQGKVPESHIRVLNEETGTITEAPIPGSKDATAEQKQQLRDWGIGNLMLKKVEEARANSSQWSTGFWGNILKNVGGTEARDLQATLDTLLSNRGFETLQAMRDSSPTGGALGQVTERELTLLQSTLSSLDQAQSRPQFEKHLDEFEDYYRAILTGYGRDGRPAVEVLGFDPKMEDGWAPAPPGAVPPQKDKAVVVTSREQLDSIPSGTLISIGGIERVKP